MVAEQLLGLKCFGILRDLRSQYFPFSLCLLGMDRVRYLSGCLRGEGN
jgi:hypothetical protein